MRKGQCQRGLPRNIGKFFKAKLRSSQSRMFFKISVLKNIVIFTKKYLCWSLFLIKLQAWRSATLLKRDSKTAFSCEYCDTSCGCFYKLIFRAPLADYFYINTWQLTCKILCPEIKKNKIGLIKWQKFWFTYEMKENKPKLFSFTLRCFTWSFPIRCEQFRLNCSSYRNSLCEFKNGWVDFSTPMIPVNDSALVSSKQVNSNMVKVYRGKEYFTFSNKTVTLFDKSILQVHSQV